MILVVTAPGDPHADRVARLLAARSVPFAVFDPAEFPGRATISLSVETEGVAGSVTWSGGSVRLVDVGVVWLRKPGVPAADPSVTDPLARRTIADLAGVVLDDAWALLGCPWVAAPPHVLGRAGRKALQLALARQLGFDVPSTLLSNAPDEFLELHRRSDGRLVSKLPGRSALSAPDGDFCRFTEVVSTRDVAYAGDVRLSPMIFQSYVPKRIELRVTVVGDEVFAAEIHSQESNHTRYDWRRYDHGRTGHAVHVLPGAVADRCRALVTALGLRYGAIDFVVTPEERYVFLELNPNGQYLWIEELTGLPITAAVADLLTGLNAAWPGAG